MKDETKDGRSGRRAAIVFNPTKVDLPRLQRAVADAASSAAWDETLWFETSIDDVGEGVAKKAVDQGVQLVLAAGGDGTVRAVAQSLRGTGVPRGLLPAGTGNLFARNLHLTLTNMPTSVIVAFSGEDRPIDIGIIDIERANGERDRHAYVVMAGMGIDAKMIQNTDDDLKAKAGWAAYVNAIVKSLRDPDELHLQFKLDDAPQKRATVHTLIVGNCGSLPANILLLPDAVIDDGLFDLMMIRPRGVLGWISVWTKVAWTNGVVRRTKAGRLLVGEHRNDKNLHYDNGKKFTARLSKPEEIELDGDAFGKAVAFTTWIEAGDLIVRVPAP